MQNRKQPTTADTSLPQATGADGSSVSDSLRTVFHLDPRGLALFRILMGLLISFKILYLWPNLGLLFADDGVLPRELLSKVTRSPWDALSAYAWISSLNAVHALALLHLCVALAFSAGWRTRVVTPLLWFLTISLDMRNPLILNGGDKLMGTFLFWGIFLPLGARFSLDARRKGPGEASTHRFAGALTCFGSACFILQLVTLYVLSGHAKSHPLWVLDFNALQCAFQNETYVLPLGRHLVDFPNLLKLLTVATIYLEQLLVLLALSPVYNRFFRVVIPVLFILLHAGIALTLNVGLFAYACGIVWLAMFPTAVYDWLEHRLKGTSTDQPSIFQTPTDGFQGWLPLSTAAVWMTYLVVGTFFPGKKAGWQYIATEPVRLLKLTQKWGFYAPHPAFSTRWYAIQAVDQPGRSATIYPTRSNTFSAVTETIDPSTYPTFYLRKYFRKLARKKNESLYNAALDGIRNYWLSFEEIKITNVEIIGWQRYHYPEAEVEPKRRLFYSTSSGIHRENPRAESTEIEDQDL